MSTPPPGLRLRSVPPIRISKDVELANQAAEEAKKKRENMQHDQNRPPSRNGDPARRSSGASDGGRDSGRGKRRGGKGKEKVKKNKPADARRSASNSAADGSPHSGADHTPTPPTNSLPRSSGTQAPKSASPMSGAHTAINAAPTPDAAVQIGGANALQAAQGRARSRANENGRRRADQDPARPVDKDAHTPASTGSSGPADSDARGRVDEPAAVKTLSALLGTRGLLHLLPQPAAGFPPLNPAEFLPAPPLADLTLQAPADIALPGPKPADIASALSNEEPSANDAAGKTFPLEPEHSEPTDNGGGSPHVTLLSQSQRAAEKQVEPKDAEPDTEINASRGPSAPSFAPRKPTSGLRRVSLPAIATLDEDPSSDDHDRPATPVQVIKHAPPHVHSARANAKRIAQGAIAEEDSADEDPDAFFNYSVPDNIEEKPQNAKVAGDKLFVKAHNLCKTTVHNFPHSRKPVRCFNGDKCIVKDHTVRPNDLVAEREWPAVNASNQRDPETSAKRSMPWHWQCMTNGQLWKYKNSPELLVWSDDVRGPALNACRRDISSATDPGLVKADTKGKKHANKRKLQARGYTRALATKGITVDGTQIPPRSEQRTSKDYPKARDRPLGMSGAAFKRENRLRSMAAKEMDNTIADPTPNTTKNTVASKPVSVPEHSNEAGPSNRAEVQRKLTALVNEKKRKRAADEEEADPSKSANANGKRKSKR